MKDTTRLSDLVREEVRFMAFDKEAYDLYHPQHRREMGIDGMFSLARKRVIAALCDPTVDNGKHMNQRLTIPRASDRHAE